MPDVTRTIQIVIDATTGKAVTAFKDMKTNVGEAEGAFGKLKAGVSGAGDVLSSLPLPAVGAAAGLAIKGVLDLGNQFETAALSAKKLSDATGLTVEDASRWQEVAGDVGVSTETLAGSFGKAVKAIGTAPDKFESLGISVVHAKDGTIDMNETLLNAIGVINKIQDPTQKAALASQLFGKSWAELTPVLSEGTDTIRNNLKAVSDAKVITEGEVDSSKKWQAAMDTLGDTLDDVKLSTGKLIVDGLGPTLQSLAEMAQTADDVINSLDGFIGPLGSVGDGFATWFKYLSPVGSSLQVVKAGAEGLTTTLSALAGPLQTVADGAKVVGELVGEFGGVVGDAAGSVEDFVRGPFGGDSKKLWDDWGFGADNAKQSTDGFKQSTDGAKDSTQVFHDGITDAALALQAHILGLHDSTQALADEAANADSTAKAIDALNKLRDQAVDALSREQDAALSAIDSQVGYDRAITDVGTALTDFQTTAATTDDAIKNHGASSDEAAKAQDRMNQSARGLEDQISRTAAQAVAYATDQATASGATLTTADKIGVQIQALQDLKAKYPELGPSIDAHIAKLQAIPTEKNTDITVDKDQAEAALQAIIDKIHEINRTRVVVDTSGTHVGDAGRAEGGPVKAGVPVRVGEWGQETFVPNVDGQIVPNGKSLGSTTNMVINVNGGGPSVAQDVVRELTWAMRTGAVPV